MTWFQVKDNGIVLFLKIQSRAKKTVVVGLYGDPPRLKIKVAATPVHGEANEELLQFLKKKLGATLSALKIIRGESSSVKDVFCVGVGVEVLTRLY